MNKQLYILDHDKKLIKIVNTSTDTVDIVYDDTYTSELVTGAETYTATFKFRINKLQIWILFFRL